MIEKIETVNSKKCDINDFDNIKQTLNSKRNYIHILNGFWNMVDQSPYSSGFLLHEQVITNSLAPEYVVSSIPIGESLTPNNKYHHLYKGEDFINLQNAITNKKPIIHKNEFSFYINQNKLYIKGEKLKHMSKLQLFEFKIYSKENSQKADYSTSFEIEKHSASHGKIFQVIELPNSNINKIQIKRLLENKVIWKETITLDK